MVFTRNLGLTRKKREKEREKEKQKEEERRREEEARYKESKFKMLKFLYNNVLNDEINWKELNASPKLWACDTTGNSNTTSPVFDEVGDDELYEI